jgi:hypothetical protein
MWNKGELPMNMVTETSPIILWQEVVKQAELRCSITLENEVEFYLISLLMRYTNQPELAKQVFASKFLHALRQSQHERHVSLQHVGDQCLIYAGLFPHAAERKLVKISYFVDLGRAAYANISHKINDIYWSLALQFVVLMDVLQSIRGYADLLPLEAYEQWNELGSQRAYAILQQYSAHGMPFKK